MKFSLRGSRPDRGSFPVRLFVFSLLIFPLTSRATPIAPSSGVPEEWMRLLHYRKSAFGGWVNDAGPKFFVDPNGASNAEAEWEASKREVAKPDSDFHCRFPARALLLKRIDPTLPVSKKSCPDFESFRTRLAASGASVVFSSYYLNNPSSAFGHSFLRIHRAGSKSDSGGKSTELLDTGVGYAAQMTTQNALLYAVYGIFGLFSGEYMALPYYYKVREYADAENRDLWSYDLDLSPAEIELLVAHLWELPSAERRYYYFSKNCAYELLAIVESILDAKRGRPGILDRVPWFVIPSHTLQALVQEPGLVRSVQYRPSLRKVLEARLDQLNSEERTAARDWTGVTSDPKLGAKVLDARIDWMDFEMFEKLVRDDPQATALKQAALVARAQTGVVAEEQTVPASGQSEPTQGHRPRRILVSAGKNDSASAFGLLSFRPALQDLLDPATGYPDSARLEFTSATIRFAPRPRVEELSLFRAQSLTPIGRVRLDPSWKVGVLMDRNSGARNSSDLAGRFEVSGGMTVPVLPGSTALRAFALTGARMHFGSMDQGTWIRPAASLELGLHGRLGDRFAVLATWERFRFLNAVAPKGDRFRSVLGLASRFSLSRDWGVQFAYENQSGVRSWQSGVSYFF